MINIIHFLALNKRDIVIKGDGKSVRSYLYTADLVVWLLRILSSGKNRDVYNVGSNQQIVIRDLANTIGLNSIDVRILGNETGRKTIYVPCVNKSKIDLGLDIYTSLQATIIKTFNFYT